jgi:hypothetical protein
MPVKVFGSQVPLNKVAFSTRSRMARASANAVLLLASTRQEMLWTVDCH